MTDPRVTEHAKIVVNHSCKVQKSDFVLMICRSGANELITEIASQLGRLGAQFMVMYSDDSFNRAFSLSADDATLSVLPSQLYNLIRDTDVIINIISSSNSQEMSDVPPHNMQVRARALGALSPIMMKKRWNITLHPTAALAQDARMSYEAYSDFVYSATLRDWPKMVSEMQVLYDKMISTKRVHIVGKDTDISFSVEGRKPIIDGGEKNLPGGEVFVSPLDSTVNGRVHFDLPIIFSGHEIRGTRLQFKNGEVVESSAEEGFDVLKEMLSVDDGARRLGELGIGMNRGINKFTKNILFDEKMGDTFHMAIGESFEESGGTNKSAIHIDMIKNIKEDGAIYFDDSPIYKSGKFVWE
ncbi:MAG: aminopeptidase [Nitrososphaerota archaeon]|nr:aminopeptidase [Nitrososphaerota archaeon]